uniref:Cytochrome P450 n=1 Tax=Stomoxys calcitrans TaxID=35570 RepID=A0A1I8NYI9_STOCA
MELTTSLWYILITLIFGIIFVLKKNLNYWKDLGIPHEEPHALFGNMSGLRTKLSFGEILTRYYAKFKGSGPFAGIFVGQRPGAVVLDKELIKRILIKDFTQFTDRGLYYNQESDPLTGHLFLVDGDRWRSMRNKLSPTFTSGKMKYMYPTLLKVSDSFVATMASKALENPLVEIRSLLARYTVDIIGSVAFGIECNSLKNEEDKFLQLGRKSVEQPRHNALVMGLIDSFPRLSRLLGMRIIPEDVHEFFMATIKDTVKYREMNNIQRNDFLNILIELKNNSEDKSGLGGMTIEELAAQVFVFFLAGFETSATTMAYALYELAQNQDLQQRLRDEVNEAFEQHQGSAAIPYETIMSLTFMDQVLAETLRKYPLVPVLFRQALNDYAVPGNPKYVIKKGIPIFIPVLGIQHDVEFYANPQEFDPDRFLPDLVKQRDPMEWLPFGDGPRNCIGMRFAKMQSRLGLACAIRNFRFTVCPKTEIPLSYAVKPLVLLPGNPIYLNVEAL